VRPFDLNPQEMREIKRLVRWHAAYLLLVAAYFGCVYWFGLFRSGAFFTERFIFFVLSPASTAAFVLVSPWRGRWISAVSDMYFRLEGQAVFCAMAAFVFAFGFYAYSIFIWGLGALGPALVYM
jgi:hypothetical protein